MCADDNHLEKLESYNPLSIVELERPCMQLLFKELLAAR